jgi:hypothetical protein
MDDNEKLRILEILAGIAPEALGVFLVLDVRQYNLTGKHIGQTRSLATVGGAGGSQGGNVNVCDSAVLQKDYLDYVAGEGLARRNALSMSDWKAQYRPQCP